MQKKSIAVVVILVGAALLAGLYFLWVPGRMTPGMLSEAIEAEERLDNIPGETPEVAPVGLETVPFTELAEPPLSADGGIPDTFHVAYECTNGVFVAAFHKDWAPRGVKRIHEIVREGVHNDARVFRVIKGFVVQWGIPGKPSVTASWMGREIQDDPPTGHSNERGTISFAAAGKNSRGLQVFVNLGDNKSLDTYDPPFTPVGEVVYGLDVVEGFNDEYSTDPEEHQQQYMGMGNMYMDRTFPNLDSIIRTVFVTPKEGALEQAAAEGAAESDATGDSPGGAAAEAAGEPEIEVQTGAEAGGTLEATDPAPAE